MYEYRDENWLKNMYIDKRLSITQIATESNVSPTTIQKYLLKYNIKTRTISEANKGKYNGAWIDNPIKDIELLYQEYVINELSFKEIAEKYSTSKKTIARYIKKYNVPIDQDRLKKSRAKYLENYNYK